MSRFARIEEQAVKYQSELTGEEFRLYCLIKFHTWNDSGVCNKDLHELAEIYSLNYDHTTARYKVLRTKGWCENSKQKIKPIAHLKTDFYKSPETSKTEVVKTSKSEVSKPAKLQKVKFETSKTEVDNAAKLQKVKFPLNPYIEPLKDENFIDTTHDEKTAGVSVENGNNFSKFSLPECLAYVEICKKNGDDIRNPRALAITLHQNGSADAFIEAALYPEQSAPEQTVVYDEENHLEELYLPETEPLSDTARESSLVMLRGMLRDTSLDGLQNMAEFYTADDWAWLMAELNGVEK